MAKVKAESVEAYFASHDGPVGEIACALRDQVRAVAGEMGAPLTEALAWGYPCWGGNERILSIIAHKARCNLQLFSGARLADDFSEIEGTGKQLRHVKVGALSDVNDRTAAIVRAAIALDRDDPERVR